MTRALGKFRMAAREERMRLMAEVKIPDAICALDSSQKSTMDVRCARVAPRERLSSP